MIPRLTAAAFRRACRKGKVAGWYELCRKGYLPREVMVHEDSYYPESEVRFKVRDYARSKGLPVPANCAEKRKYVRREPEIKDCRAAFRASVMRTGLALVLTQPMLESLCAIACNVRRDRALHFNALGSAKPDNFIATNAALAKRGLIDCEHKLTPIGSKVIELLKEAEVFVMPDAALEAAQ